eukprot:361314-Chlamydomonas_euryale.AAC.2
MHDAWDSTTRGDTSRGSVATGRSVRLSRPTPPRHTFCATLAHPHPRQRLAQPNQRLQLARRRHHNAPAWCERAGGVATTTRLHGLKVWGASPPQRACMV